jgi:hypothetical protein
LLDFVRQHDEKLCCIERVIFSEKFARKLLTDKLRTVAGRSVHDENGVAALAFRVFIDLAERSIMNPQLRQGSAGCELEIVNRIIALGRRRIIGSPRRANRCDTDERCRDNSAHDFV